MVGKGDTPRPVQDKERFRRNWDRIFGLPGDVPAHDECRKCGTVAAVDEDGMCATCLEDNK